jgi:hypothetical protein
VAIHVSTFHNTRVYLSQEADHFTHQSATVTRTLWQHRSQHLASFMNGLELHGRRLHTRRLLPHGVAKPSTPLPLHPLPHPLHIRTRPTSVSFLLSRSYTSSHLAARFIHLDTGNIKGVVSQCPFLRQVKRNEPHSNPSGSTTLFKPGLRYRRNHNMDAKIKTYRYFF